MIVLMEEVHFFNKRFGFSPKVHRIEENLEMGKLEVDRREYKISNALSYTFYMKEKSGAKGALRGQEKTFDLKIFQFHISI